MFKLFDKLKKEDDKKEIFVKSSKPKKYYYLYIKEFNLDNHILTVTGYINGNSINKKDEVYILGKDEKIIKTSILSIESKINTDDSQNNKNELVHIKLDKISTKDIDEGDILTNIKPSRDIENTEKINSLRLYYLLCEYLKNKDLFVKNLLFEEFSLFSTTLSPVIYLNKNDLSDVKLPIVKIKEKLSKKEILYYPVFTSYKKAVSWKFYESGQKIIPMKLDDYIYLLTVVNSNISGLVFNPDKEQLFISKKELIKLYKIKK